MWYINSESWALGWSRDAESNQGTGYNVEPFLCAKCGLLWLLRLFSGLFRLLFWVFWLLHLDYADYSSAFGLLDYYNYCYWIIHIICIIVIIVIIASQVKICVDLILKKTLFDTALYCTRSWNSRKAAVFFVHINDHCSPFENDRMPLDIVRIDFPAMTIVTIITMMRIMACCGDAEIVPHRVVTSPLIFLTLWCFLRFGTRLTMCLCPAHSLWPWNAFLVWRWYKGIRF